MNTNTIETTLYKDYSNEKEILELLEFRLSQITEKCDSNTRKLITRSVSNSAQHNRLNFLIKLIDKVEIALRVTDVRMLNAQYVSRRNAATAIADKINGYIANGYSNDAEYLVKLFYAVGNSDIQAPRVILTKNKSQEKYLKNITSSKWWFNKIVNVIKQNREHLKLLMGLVNKDMPFASDLALFEKRSADKKRREYLESHEVISKYTGKPVPLSKLEKSERQKFGEINCILNGIDKYAKTHNMSSALITITAPGNSHISSSNYNYQTPKEINRAISEKWSKCTREFLKINEFYFAYRANDLHKDGTPHSHVLIYFKNELKEKYQAILKRKFSVDSLSGNLIDWKDIDRKKGTCIGYILKSLVPVNHDSDPDFIDNNERIASGRRLWNFRSHDYSGMPRYCIACWRELRKLVNEEVSDKKAMGMLRHVKENNFCSFFMAYKNGSVSLLLGEDNKIVGVDVFGVHVSKKKNNNMQRIVNLKTKVNVINYPSIRITNSLADLDLTKGSYEANDMQFCKDSQYMMTAKSIVNGIRLGVAEAVCKFILFFRGFTGHSQS